MYLKSGEIFFSKQHKTISCAQELSPYVSGVANPLDKIWEVKGLAALLRTMGVLKAETYGGTGRVHRPCALPKIGFIWIIKVRVILKH